MKTHRSFRLSASLCLAALLLTACGSSAVTPAVVPPTAVSATATPVPPTGTPVPPTATSVPPTDTATSMPTDTPIPATATPTLTPTQTATATPAPTRRPTVAPTIALKCPPLPAFQGQTLPFDPPLPLPLSKAGFGQFGAIVFQNSTNQQLSIQVIAGNVTNHINLPVGTESSAVVLPGAQKVTFNYPPPGGTECTYQVAADQVLFMQIGGR